MLNWGIIGTANIARRSVVPALLESPQHNVIAVAGRKKAKADIFAKEFRILGLEGYQTLLDREDIDTVYIPLPTGMHFEWAMKALKAGKHVLLEKSSVTNFKEAKETVNEARKNNLALVEHFQFQHHSQHRFVSSLLKEGKIGEIRCFRSSFGFPPFSESDNIRYKKELGGGALLDAGAYTLKVISFLLGDGFEVDSAFLNYHSGYEVDWYGGGQLINKEKGIFAQAAFGFDNFYQCSYEIWGSKGKITSTRAYTAKPGFEPQLIVETNDGKEIHTLPSDDHFKNIQNHFYELVQRKDFEKEYEAVLRQAALIEQFFKKANT